MHWEITCEYDEEEEKHKCEYTVYRHRKGRDPQPVSYITVDTTELAGKDANLADEISNQIHDFLMNMGME